LGLITTPFPREQPKSRSKNNFKELNGNKLDLKKIILIKYQRNLNNIFPDLKLLLLYFERSVWIVDIL
tara:strand:+ start:781 stop:984 length:204 start_codon:yes stop_codon:yes gene_type:complete